MQSIFKSRLACVCRLIISKHDRRKHTLPPLAYEYNALEPIISKETLAHHHSKVHAALVVRLNEAEQRLQEAAVTGDLEKIIRMESSIRFNGGGHVNHSILWDTLSPNGQNAPTGELLEGINRDFGSFDRMKKYLTSISIGLTGSGWSWLGFNPYTRRLRMTSCSNEDPLEPTTGLIPLFGIDVWEHAYYLQNKEKRTDYVNEIFQIINWNNVAKRYANVKSIDD